MTDYYDGLYKDAKRKTKPTKPNKTMKHESLHYEVEWH